MAMVILPTGARGKAQVSLNNMPEGPGKQLIANKCGTACHGLDRVLDQPRTTDDWTNIVVLMRDYGAKISVQEQKTIVAYLSKNLGRAPTPPKAASVPPVITARANSSAQSAATSRPAGASKSSSASVSGQAAGKSAADANMASNGGGAAAPTVLPPGPGKELVQTKCTICHNLDRILQSHRTRSEWQQLVTMMQDYGADVSGDEEKTVVDYLAKSFPASK
jgi:cytochrome c5